MPIRFSHRMSAAPDVLFRMVGDEAVLLKLGTERYLGLDPVGARLWTVLTQSQSLESGFQSLLGEYDVEAGRLRLDVEEFVDALAAQGLIETASVAEAETVG